MSTLVQTNKPGFEKFQHNCQIITKVIIFVRITHLAYQNSLTCKRVSVLNEIIFAFPAKITQTTRSDNWLLPNRFQQTTLLRKAFCLNVTPLLHMYNACCRVRGKNIWRPSCKKGVYRILADFHFLQDRANFWQTDLFWHEMHSSVIVSVDLRFVLQK